MFVFFVTVSRLDGLVGDEYITSGK